MNPYYIALWVMFVLAVVGMYAAFRWGYEVGVMAKESKQ